MTNTNRPEVSTQELRLIGLLARGLSDVRIRAALGATPAQAIALAGALREKLGTLPHETIVAAARRHGLVAS